ncbi:Calx-beta domain-containing protein [Azospirillum tabaci]|uniref:Calx-beta domain-containing protein n=1 Tax=Azospirillum tabaci TaxID=2752310 RepID=UPI001660EF0E|nr:Calx-beta domain-containing protein [Azospirillum tabaci]
MAMTASGKFASGKNTNAGYKFELVRSDDGKATISMLKDGSPVSGLSGVKAVWDDAIPWSAGPKFLKYDRDVYVDAPSFRMSPEPAGRTGILLHSDGGFQGTTKPTNVTLGCVATDADFLKSAADLLAQAGVKHAKIPFEVKDVGAAPVVQIDIAVNNPSIKEGESGTFRVSLSGPGTANGVTKDIWVRLNVEEPVGNQPKADWDFVARKADGTPRKGDFAIVPVDGGQTTYQSTDMAYEGGGLLSKQGLYVKIPAGQQSATYKVVARNDREPEGTVAGGARDGKEVINLSIDDYYVYDEKWKMYGDSQKQPGVLLPKAKPASMTIEDPSKLLNENLSGGVEGLRKVYDVTAGDVISFNFDALSVPDSLLITDGQSSVGTGGLVSGVHTGQMTAATNQISVVVVGSSSGTAWTLGLRAQPAVVTTSAMAALAPEPIQAGQLLAEAPQSASNAAVAVLGLPENTASAATPMNVASRGAAPQAAPAAATVTLVQSWEVAVPANGEAAPVSYTALAGREYLARLVGEESTGRDPDLDDGYLKIHEGSNSQPASVSQFSDMRGQPAEFFKLSADTTLSFVAGSDIVGQGGTARIELFDVTGMTAPVLHIDAPDVYRTSEGTRDGVAVRIARIGDLEQAATYQVAITPTGAAPIAADDLGGGPLTRTVRFEAGQSAAVIDVPVPDDGRAEGAETGLLSLDLSAVPAEVSDNMAVLGLRSQVGLEIRDRPAIITQIVPTLSSGNAAAAEADGFVRFEVRLSDAPTSPVSVFYTTVNETSITGQDYTAQSGEITFEIGETSKVIDIPIARDGVVEPDETFALKILDAYGVILDGNSEVLTYRGTIHDTATATYQIRSDATGPFVTRNAGIYGGPVNGLEYEIIASDGDEVVVATPGSDFVNMLGGVDGVDGGGGNDVLDGGTGSNFLTGGDGRDIFFLDGRGGQVTWGTVTDFSPGEEVNLWGWQPGQSSATWVSDAGAPGYTGLTMHADLDGNGTVDASLTLSGWSAQPRAQELNDLLWLFG